MAKILTVGFKSLHTHSEPLICLVNLIISSFVSIIHSEMAVIVSCCLYFHPMCFRTPAICFEIPFVLSSVSAR